MLKSILFLSVLGIIVLSETRYTPPNISSLSEKIVGGGDAVEGQFPAIVHLEIKMYLSGFLISYLCAGSIIYATWILTAAHCLTDPFTGMIAKQVTVTAGEYDLSVPSGHEQIIDSKNFIRHPNYNPNTQANDIALIKLDKNLTFNQFVQPISLPPSSRMDIPTGSLMTIIGWGTISEDGPSSDRLKSALVPRVSNEDCSKAYDNTTDSKMICAGNVHNDTCQGDSGSPLIYEGNVVGITSWGRGCAREGFPGVYTLVGAFVDEFIKPNTVIP